MKKILLIFLYFSSVFSRGQTANRVLAGQVPPFGHPRNVMWVDTANGFNLMRNSLLDSLGPYLNTIPYSNLVGKPTNVSDFANDAGYMTSSVATSSFAPIADTFPSGKWMTTFGAMTAIEGVEDNIQSRLDTNHTIKINGVTKKLVTNPEFSVGDVITSGSYADPDWISSIAWSKITGAPAFITTETDPIWSADKPSYSTTAAIATNYYSKANLQTSGQSLVHWDNLTNKPAFTSGTVTGASVVTANGFAGSVATSTTTPAITVSTTVTGVIKGNGTAMSAAVAGTDYLSPTGNGSGLTSLNASSLASGTVGSARLGSGSATSSTYLRGDGTWSTLPSGGTVTNVTGTLPISIANPTTTPDVSIANAKADASTKGAATFNSSYFSDNGSGLIANTWVRGTGTISSNAVTINAPRGLITYTSPSILAAGTVSVTLTNSFITSTSTISLTINGLGSDLTGSASVYLKSAANGSCIINIRNLNLLSLFNNNFGIDFTVQN